MKKMKGADRDNRTAKPAKGLNKIVFYSVLAAIVIAIGLFVPYAIMSFLKHKSLVFDVEIFKDKTLWTWFGITVGVAVVGVIGFSIYYDLFNHNKLLNKNEAAKSDLYGDSRFLTKSEIEKKFGDYNFNDLPSIDTCGPLIQSYRKRGNLYVSLVKEEHALVAGVSGDGKSLRHLGVTIQANGKSKLKPSMLVNDMKGELWNMHSKFLREQGYDTILLDLRNPTSSARLNPINILWKLKKAAEETKLEMTDEELDEYFSYYRIFKGDISIEEFCKFLTAEEKVAINNNNVTTQDLYNDYIVQIKKLDFKQFPSALQKEPLKRFISLPESFYGLSASDKHAFLYHKYLDYYKLFLKCKKSLTRDELYKEWQRSQFDKKMSKLNRTSGLVNEFAAQIVPEGTGENKQWSDGAQGICAAILLAMLEDGFSPELNFTEEMFTITQISNIVNRFGKDLNEFLKLRDLDSKVFDYAGPILDNPAEKTVAGYMSNLQTPLRNYLEEGIEYLMSGTDVNFENIIAKPTAIFLLLPEEFPARYPIANMYITQIYNELLFQSNDFAENNFKLPRPFYFFLDEFGNMPKLANLSSWITLCRSRNIWFTLYVQALSQIKGKYDEHAASTIMQNCHLQILMGATEESTLEHFQKLFGERTIVKRNASFDPKTSDIDFKGSSSLEKAPLVTTTHLGKIPVGEIYWKVHKDNPGRTHLEIIYDNLNVLKIGTYDKPAESYKPYDKAARIYNINARNKYVKELDGLLAAATETPPDDVGSDGGANASIPTGFDFDNGFVPATPEWLEQNANGSSSKSATPPKKKNGGGGGSNPHIKLINNLINEN